jgi:hypothetical protein
VSTRALLIAAAALLALAGCSSGAGKADDLHKYLADQWSFSPDYAAVKNADISYSGGDVKATTDLTDIDFTQAQEVCGWVSAWLYDQGNGDAQSTIQILDRSGDVLSQRKHANDSCSMG